MSTTKLFRLYDSKAEQWLSLIQHRNAETAKRELANAVNTPNNQFNLYAEDYTLFEVGSFSDDDPLPVSNKTAISVCVALTLREPENVPVPLPFNMPITNTTAPAQWPDRPHHPNNASPQTAEVQRFIQNAAEELVTHAEAKRHNTKGTS